MITDGEKWHYLALKSLPKFDDKKENGAILLEKACQHCLGE